MLKNSLLTEYRVREESAVTLVTRQEVRLRVEPTRTGRIIPFLGNLSSLTWIQKFKTSGFYPAPHNAHFLFGGKWHIKDLPDLREKLGNDLEMTHFLCTIAASKILIGGDLTLSRARKSYWDKSLVLDTMESAPE